jgi:hypothetical protein
MKKKWIVCVIILFFAIVSFLLFSEVDSERIKLEKKTVENYTKIVDFEYKISNKLPTDLKQIGLNDTFHFFWIKEWIAYEKLSDSTFKFIINESGGIAEYYSELEKWEWHD